jgi:hypothetical protein
MVAVVDGGVGEVLGLAWSYTMRGVSGACQDTKEGRGSIGVMAH